MNARGAGPPKRLEDEAKMATMLEGPLEPDDMLLVLRIGLVQLHQDLRLLQTSTMPAGA